MNFAPVTSIAVTSHNLAEHIPEIVSMLMSSTLIGLDIETHQARAHAGVQAFNVGKKMAFDINRTDLCGLSIWGKGSPTAFYFNVGHADVAGRIAWPQIERLLNVKPPISKWVIHNAPFEITMLAKTVGWTVRDYICTLQMAVSAYGPDEYDFEAFRMNPLGEMIELVPQMARLSVSRNSQDFKVQELLAKICAKETSSSYSWNGVVAAMAYGYSLKKAVQSWFGYTMVTYKQVLGTKNHMGELTTDEVVSYGCDDAIWCCRLYDRLLSYMLDSNPAVVSTYFTQELPAVQLYAECWRDGVRINVPAVQAKELELRGQFAAKSRTLKALVRQLLPFNDAPHDGLYKYESWYAKNYQRYRNAIASWALSPNSTDDFTQAIQLSGSIPSDWMKERGVVNPKQLNITHYMPARTLLYDLFGQEKLIIDKGKVQSDGDTRGRMREAMTKQGKTVQADVLKELGELGSLQQTESLFIAPYMKLMDPDTGRMYPTLNSMLATRRMAMSQPNATQLTKRGESVYVRSFFVGDTEDHVIVSIDFVQIELVLIGEESGDPEFARCYSSIPFDDLHKLAAAACLEVSDDEFDRLRRGLSDVSPHLLVNTKNEPLALDKAYKYWRTEVGKGANFEFWYSGLLANLGQRLDWPTDKMFEMSEKYASRFHVAAMWRQMVIGDAQVNGYTPLVDGHRRVKVEATRAWAEAFRNKFRRYENPDVMWFVDLIIRKIQRRAGNIAVNSKIQGGNATLTKRSMVRIHRALEERGWGHDKARLMFPVHDEIVASVHRDHVRDYIELARPIMMHHPDVVKNLIIDCSPSVGRHFQPWSTDVPGGQIELFECPKFEFIPEEFWGGRVPPEYWGRIVEYLYEGNEKGLA